MVDLYAAVGGAHWNYTAGTDAVSGGKPWRVADATSDPCVDEWFGVGCDANGTHVVSLFPNTRGSGNPLIGVLPASIGALSRL